MIWNSSLWKCGVNNRSVCSIMTALVVNWDVLSSERSGWNMKQLSWEPTTKSYRLSCKRHRVVRWTSASSWDNFEMMWADWTTSCNTRTTCTVSIVAATRLSLLEVKCGDGLRFDALMQRIFSELATVTLKHKLRIRILRIHALITNFIVLSRVLSNKLQCGIVFSWCYVILKSSGY